MTIEQLKAELADACGSIRSKDEELAGLHAELQRNLRVAEGLGFLAPRTGDKGGRPLAALEAGSAPSARPVAHEVQVLLTAMTSPPSQGSTSDTRPAEQQPTLLSLPALEQALVVLIAVVQQHTEQLADLAAAHAREQRDRMAEMAQVRKEVGEPVAAVAELRQALTEYKSLTQREQVDLPAMLHASVTPVAAAEAPRSPHWGATAPEHTALANDVVTRTATLIHRLGNLEGQAACVHKVAAEPGQEVEHRASNPQSGSGKPPSDLAAVGVLATVDVPGPEALASYATLATELDEVAERLANETVERFRALEELRQRVVDLEGRSPGQHKTPGGQCAEGLEWQAFPKAALDGGSASSFETWLRSRSTSSAASSSGGGSASTTVCTYDMPWNSESEEASQNTFKPGILNLLHRVEGEVPMLAQAVAQELDALAGQLENEHTLRQTGEASLSKRVAEVECEIQTLAELLALPASQQQPGLPRKARSRGAGATPKADCFEDGILDLDFCPGEKDVGHIPETTEVYHIGD